MFEPKLQVDALHKRKGKHESYLKHFRTEVKQTFISKLRESCNEYLMDTTLHGLKYVGERKISRLERYVKVFFFQCRDVSNNFEYYVL